MPLPPRTGKLTLPPPSGTILAKSMKTLNIAIVFVAASVAAGVSPALAQTARTPWGDPDLQGTYTNSNESGIPMQRPAEFAGKTLDDITPGRARRA